MNVKNVLLSAALASSSISDARDVPSSVEKTSHQVHESLAHNKGGDSHSHLEVFAGFEHNHLMKNGQLLEGDFSSVGIHGSRGNLGAYYHWLQSEKGILEHKVGVTYSYSFTESLILKTGLSSVYEVTGSEHADHTSISGTHRNVHTEMISSKNEKNETTMETLLYTPISVEMEAILNESESGKTTFSFGGETSIGDIHTSFLYAELEHVQDFSFLQMIVSAKIINVLESNSSHIEQGAIGMGEIQLKTPIGDSGKWSFDLGGQLTTRGDKTGLIGLSRIF